TITAIREEVVEDLINGFIPPQPIEDQWDVAGLEKQIEMDFGLRLTIAKWLEEDTRLHEETLRKKILTEIQGAYDTKCERVGDIMLEIEKQVMLQVLDNAWKDHLATMDHLRQGINLRSYAQRNPKQEYKREAFELFQSLLMTVKRETIHLMARVEPISREQMEEMENQRREELARQKMQLRHDELSALGEAEPEPAASAPRTPSTVVREGRKVGRNDPCPCGSGKKFKSCHGALE
ncbi:MAG TPA: SEC-C metal-binding domain-containing protein, partial [Cellvibrio sp.]